MCKKCSNIKDIRKSWILRTQMCFFIIILVSFSIIDIIYITSKTIYQIHKDEKRIRNYLKDFLPTAVYTHKNINEVKLKLF